MTTALVTGASAGIGTAFCRELARTGHDLVLVSRTASRLAELGASLEAEFGVATEALAADLADPADLDRVADRLAGTGALGPVDLLVNNAGFGLNTGFLDSQIADEQRMLDVLCRATLVLSHAAGRAMAGRGYGGILTVSSVAGFFAQGTYSAAKAWQTVFSEGLALDLEPHGVAVGVVCPGFTRTEFHSRADLDVSALPGIAWLEADDVAKAALADLRRGRVVSVPGAQYKAARALLGVLPRGFAARVATGRARGLPRWSPRSPERLAR